MHGPPFPASLEQLRHRAFSFYPAIVNVEHNEWTFGRADWTGIQVINTKSSADIWVPLQLLGEISLIDEPVVIVGLAKELEYREGVLLPHVRRVIEMPRAVNQVVRPRMMAATPERTAPVVGIRIEGGSHSRAWKMIVVSIATAILVCVAVAIFIQSVVLPRKQDFPALRNRR